PLLAAGGRHAQAPLDETAAPHAGRPATRFRPQDGVPQRPLGRVVRRLDPAPPEEGPQVLLAPPTTSGTSPPSSRWRATRPGPGPAGHPTGSAGHSPGLCSRPSPRRGACATSGTAGPSTRATPSRSPTPRHGDRSLPENPCEDATSSIDAA